MSRFYSKVTKNIEPYTPGEQPKDKKYIKINTNENPYPPSPKVLTAIKENANENIRLYPDPKCSELTKTIANYYDVAEDNIFIGNGSDEVLAFIFPAFFNPNDDVILFPDITYSFYPVYAGLYDIKYVKIPLKEDFSIPINAFNTNAKGIIIPNPNAPTGKAETLENIEKLVKGNRDKLIVIDEAYIDFGSESAIHLTKDYDNLLVVQTFSKSRSLAGLRVGFAIGNTVLIDGLERMKNSFNSYPVDRVAQIAAKEAVIDEAYFRESCEKIIKVRDYVTEELIKMNFNVIPSKANFVFASHIDIKAEVLFKQLKAEGVLVRYFNKPRINNFLRISIGTELEMNMFIEKLTKIIEKAKLI